ncbi:BPSL0761 family protein [Paraburkholderia fynbosensis]|uniref:BPSL0761 family protein n=1 Tax=Paraburkholderia fynbosensis TaxID=1200993 RepID=UPI003CCE2890
MTTSYERTLALFQTRDLLEALVCAPDEIAHRMVREEALRLLEHYPLNAHIQLTAIALPDMWDAMRRR